MRIMLFFPVALAVLSCDVPPHVSLRPLRDVKTDVSYCRAAADNLYMLGCEGFAGFETTCLEAEKSGAYFPARCLSEIVTCLGVRRCLRDRVQ